MLVAALGFVWMAVCSMGLELPLTQGNAATEGARVSANVLISTYLILTFAELLLSPIGISFVSKVAPPKYAGLMMGLWFGATAIGNQLVMVPGIMWGMNFNLVTIWGVLAGICLVSALNSSSLLMNATCSTSTLSELTKYGLSRRERMEHLILHPWQNSSLVKTFARVIY